MAECSDLSKDFENIEELVTCTICDDIMTDPKLLPKCFHAFCFACIKTWAKSCHRKRKPVNCPFCRTHVGEDIASLPTSFLHNSLIQVYNSYKSRKKNQELQQLKEETAKQDDVLNEVLDMCNTAIEESEENNHRTDRKVDFAKNQVSRNTSLLIKILQKHEKTKLDNLEAIRTRLKAKREEMVNKISEHKQEILKLKSDMKIEQLKAEDYQRLLDACQNTITKTKSALSDHCNSQIVCTPNPEVVEVLENLPVGNIDMTQKAYPSRCSIECVQPGKLGFFNQFNIVTRDSKGNQCHTNEGLIDVNIKDIDGNAVEKGIMEFGVGQFAVIYIVAKPSPYNVAVHIRGKPIQNSPQSINVLDSKIDFKLISFFQTTRATFPESLAINGKGEIVIVSNNSCRIVLYSANGEYVRDFGDVESECPLGYSRGIAFTNDVHVLVTNNTDDGACIKEYHINGRLLRTVHDQKGMIFIRLRSSERGVMCLSRNKQSKETSIMLFSRETGDHLQDIKLQVPDVDMRPWYMAYGNNMYFLSFHIIHTIYVFDANGGFMYTFGEGHAWHPCGLSVLDTDMLLVCDSDNHRIHLFSQNGVFIRSFGSDVVQMSWPVDIAVTPDGRVVVLELVGERIQVCTVKTLK